MADWTPIANLINRPADHLELQRSWSKRRLAQSAAAMRVDPADAPVFQHSVLCQTSLPYRRPVAREYQRQNGNVSILIEAGRAHRQDTDDWVPLPLPSGPVARLFLIYLDTQAVHTKSPRIELADSMTAFAEELLHRAPNGRELRHFQEEAVAVAGALFRFAVDGRQLDMKVVRQFEFWYAKSSRQRILWPTFVELAPEYFLDLARHAVPLDPRAIAALAHNALALDVYKWLAQRLCRITSPTPVSWAALEQQFGQGFSRLRDFRHHFNETLRMVLTQYQAANVDSTVQGLILRPSRPPIARKVFALTP